MDEVQIEVVSSIWSYGNVLDVLAKPIYVKKRKTSKNIFFPLSLCPLKSAWVTLHSDTPLILPLLMVASQ